MKRKIVGHCSVDSGRLILLDPCYLRHLGATRGKDATFDQMWSTICEAAHTHDEDGAHAGPFGGTEHLRDLGVVTETGFGDGSYPVVAEIDDTKWGKRVVAIHVYFDGREDSD